MDGARRARFEWTRMCRQSAASRLAGHNHCPPRCSQRGAGRGGGGRQAGRAHVFPPRKWPIVLPACAGRLHSTHPSSPARRPMASNRPGPAPAAPAGCIPAPLYSRAGGATMPRGAHFLIPTPPNNAYGLANSPGRDEKFEQRHHPWRGRKIGGGQGGRGRRRWWWGLKTRIMRRFGRREDGHDPAAEDVAEAIPHPSQECRRLGQRVRCVARCRCIKEKGGDDPGRSRSRLSPAPPRPAAVRPAVRPTRRQKAATRAKQPHTVPAATLDHRYTVSPRCGLGWARGVDSPSNPELTPAFAALCRHGRCMSHFVSHIHI